ncbi:unnamed protein product [Rhizophagus irregularis]|nr:unnamed protein product [Rhizophagus irregularis]CAB5349020.1 unnamed protein product [Rhizophagus irregularis]
MSLLTQISRTTFLPSRVSFTMSQPLLLFNSFNFIRGMKIVMTYNYITFFLIYVIIRISQFPVTSCRELKYIWIIINNYIYYLRIYTLYSK